MNELSFWWSIKENFHDQDSLLGNSFELKNDEEKVKSLLQYFLQHEAPFTIKQEFKNTTKANELIERADECAKSKSWQFRSLIYTQAVIYAEPNSHELAQAYANRSAALYKGGLYENSRMDIERAIKIGYPDILNKKLYARRAKCFLAINEKLSPEFENILPQTPLDNCKIIGASAAVEMNYSKKFGRQVMATRDIEAGETLLVHKSYASIVEPNLMHKYCWHCSKRVWAGLPCHQCVSVIYCDEICRDEAWQEHHDIECPTIAAMLSGKMEVIEMMSLRMTVKAYKEAGTFEKLKEEIEKIQTIQDPIARCFSDDVFDSNKYTSVYSLWRDVTDTFTHAFKASIILYYLAATTTIFGEKIVDFDVLLNNKWAIFIGGLIMRNVGISLMNCVTMCIDDDYGNSIDRGGVLNPFISLFNHSCDPMVTHYVNGDINAIITIQNIKKGEQIFYDYGSIFWDKSTNKRRNSLFKKFGFLCECRACMCHWGPHSRSNFPSRPMKSWPPDIEESLTYIHAKYPDVILMSLADRLDKPSIISTTIKMINIYYQSVAEYPTKESFEFKALLHVLYCSIRC